MFGSPHVRSLALGVFLLTCQNGAGADMLRGAGENLRQRQKNTLLANPTDEPLDNNGNGPALQSLDSLADEDIHDNQVQRIVVKCKPGQSDVDCSNGIMSIASQGDVKIIHKLKKAHAYAISATPAALDELSAHGYEAHADPVRSPQWIEDSVQFADNQNHHRMLQGQTVTYNIEMVKAQEVWAEYDTKGEGVKVCVLDSGVYAQHVDLSDSLLSGYSGSDAVTPWDGDGSGHGTHVTGSIAAADNDRGVVGVAPGVEIFVVRVFDDSGNYYGSDIVAALEACRDEGVDIINMSLGGTRVVPEERELLEELYQEGILCIAASGNTYGTEMFYPAAYEVVVSVAAVDSRRDHASFSTRNSRVDVAGPGVAVWSTYNTGSYAQSSGTSMACPHATGVAALLKSHKPNATPHDIFTALIDSAEHPTSPGERDDYFGHGIVNALEAMVALEFLVDDENQDNADGRNVDPPNSNPGCIRLVARITTDKYGDETSYSLKSADGDVLFANDDLGDSRLYEEDACIDPSGCYRFSIADSYGDGIRGTGLELYFDGNLVYSGGNFGFGGYINFGEGCS